MRDFRSVWAIAGFAVAVIYTWRALRTPRRSQPKSQLGTSGFNSEPNENLLSSDDLRENYGLLQPENLTLGHMVRQKLSDGRKVTCRLLGVILEENTPEELQNQATVKSSVLEVVSEMTKYCNLYLMERVLDDESPNEGFNGFGKCRDFYVWWLG
ncbi:peroxisome biogenesis protein 22-like [Bidens hawaiensis]|uniref:peroxisome biogenesis protein 22-like n=1 Tax=Bidens hawaiensis TaxID=980011 RepID=UPI00404A2F47